MRLLGPEDPVQEPAHLWIPERRGSWGDEIADWSRSIGLPVDPEQARDIDAHASYGAGGRWVALEAVEIEGRQNGKTSGVVLPMALADCFLFAPEDSSEELPPDKVIWTAHLMKTALGTFNQIKRLIESNASLSRRVKAIRESEAGPGRGIDFMNGWSFDLMARTAGGGRGLTKCKRLVFDEALFLKVQPMGALIPTLRTHPNPQISYASSAGTPESDHLRALQKRGRKGGDPTLSYVEWRADGGWDNPGCAMGRRCTHIHREHGGPAGCTLDDEDQWVKANHSIRRGRIGLVFLRSEGRTLRSTPEGVIESGRENLGWEESGDDPASHPISAADWNERADDTIETTGVPSFFISVAPFSGSAAIGVAAVGPGGRPHAALAGYRGGVDWVLDRCKELKEAHPGAKFAAATTGGFRVLEHEFRAANVDVELWTEQEMGAACVHTGRLVDEESFTHDGDRLVSDAVTVAIKKDIGTALWVLTRKGAAGGVDLEPIYGEIGALWLLEKQTRATYDLFQSFG